MTYVNFKVETDVDGIALVTWDMPEKSMNVFTVDAMQELSAIIDATTADKRSRAWSSRQVRTLSPAVPI